MGLGLQILYKYSHVDELALTSRVVFYNERQLLSPESGSQNWFFMTEHNLHHMYTLTLARNLSFSDTQFSPKKIDVYQVMPQTGTLKGPTFLNQKENLCHRV